MHRCSGWLVVALVGSSLFSACGDSTAPGDGGSTGTDPSTSTGNGDSTSTSPEDTTGTPADTTAADTSTGASSDDATTDVSTSESTGEHALSSCLEELTSGGTEDTGDTEGCAAPGDVPDGQACSDDCECVSQSCFVVGILGGVCGECKDEGDCEGGGCTMPNPLAQPPAGAVCNDGAQGEGCNTSAACQTDLFCKTIVDVPGIITNATCSPCACDADCGADFCVPSYDVLDLSGAWVCAARGSLPDGSGCDLDGSAGSPCESGICAVADIMGIWQVGVCGECNVDADCNNGETCQPLEVDIGTGVVSPSFCS